MKKKPTTPNRQTAEPQPPATIPEPTTLDELALRARTLHKLLPVAAEDRRRAYAVLHGDPPAEHVAAARHVAAEADKACSQLSQALHSMATATAALLPSLWPELKIVGDGADWRVADYDFGSLQAELRRIESAALSALPSGGDIPATTPNGKRPWKPNKETRNIIAEIKSGMAMEMIADKHDKSMEAIYQTKSRAKANGLLETDNPDTI